MSRVTRRVFLTGCVAGSLAARLSGAEGGAGGEHDGLRGLINANDFKAFDQEYWDNAPPYEKLAALEALLPSLSLIEKAKTLNYEWAKGTHDLRIVAGRAAWNLDKMLGMRLPPVTAATTQEQAVDLYHFVAPAVKAYRRGVEDMSRTYGSKKSVAELKKAYAGKIKPGMREGFMRYQAALVDLMDEWCPIGKRVSDLTEIIGVEGEQLEQDRVYWFEDGYMAVEYWFVVNDGIIKSVLTRS